MTDKEKQILLQELCSRLPYGIKVYCGEDIIMTLRQIDKNCFCECWENEDFKCHSRWMLPYLRSMSSMTKNEQEEFFNLIVCVDNGKAVIEEDKIDAYNNFIYSHHLDNKNFIEIGLALEAPEGIYKIE